MYAVRILGVGSTGVLTLDASADGGGFEESTATLSLSSEGSARLKWKNGHAVFSATLSEYQICGEGHGSGWKCSFTLERHSPAAFQQLLRDTDYL